MGTVCGLHLWATGILGFLASTTQRYAPNDDVAEPWPYELRKELGLVKKREMLLSADATEAGGGSGGGGSDDGVTMVLSAVLQWAMIIVFCCCCCVGGYCLCQNSIADSNLVANRRRAFLIAAAHERGGCERGGQGFESDRYRSQR
ncbi:unnamed protein product, partial [Mesorhabditis spiculigera]